MSADIAVRALELIDTKAAERIRAAKAEPADAWPELDPLPELTEEDPAAFPFDALGPVLGPAARTIADIVQAPDAMAGAGVLAATALAVQPLADVVRPRGMVSPTSLFIITEGDSGSRKSEVDRIAGLPIAEQRQRDVRDYERRLAAHKNCKGDEATDPPSPRSLTVSKGTTEGLHLLLRNQPSIGVFSPEGAEVLGGHSMRAEQRPAGIAWFLKAWSGEALDSLTKGDGLSVLMGRRVSLNVLVQGVVLHGLMADPAAQGQGLIARALIAAPRSLAGTRLWRDDQPDALTHPTVTSYHAVLRELLATPHPLRTDGTRYELSPRRLPFTPKAAALWIEFYNATEQAQAPGGDLSVVLQPWASKAAEHAARIAGVLTLGSDPSAVDVSEDRMAGALEVANFYLTEHVRLMGQSRQRQHLAHLHALLQWLRSQGGEVPHAHLLQKVVRPVRDLKAEGINALMDELAQRHYVRRVGSAWKVRP